MVEAAQNHIDDMAVHPSETGLGSQVYDDDYYDSSTPHPESTTRLAAQHTTEGYRDGITASKQEYIQEGFDEGYILGAALGFKVGELLGLFDGLIGTINGLLNKESDQNAKTTLSELLEKQKKVRSTARDELSLERVFGNDYFGKDGLWKWTNEADDDDDKTFDDIVAEHPLVLIWTAAVEIQMRELGITIKPDLEALEKSDDS